MIKAALCHSRPSTTISCNDDPALYHTIMRISAESISALLAAAGSIKSNEYSINTLEPIEAIMARENVANQDGHVLTEELLNALNKNVDLMNSPGLKGINEFGDWLERTGIAEDFYKLAIFIGVMSGMEKGHYEPEPQNDAEVAEEGAAGKTAVEGEAAGNTIPQGLTSEQFENASKLIRQNVGNISDEIVVQGSRAGGTANATSDIDFAIKVSPDVFDALVKQKFGTPNFGSAKYRTMLNAIETGKIQSGEAGFRALRKQLQELLGMDVDISIIKTGGLFDNGPTINLP